MYHPTRGGTRGGAGEFTWDAVRQDKDREHYLGHSILAPTGRWQNNKDVTWYNKQNGDERGRSATEAAAAAAAAAEDATEKRRRELLVVRQREEDEMNRRLGGPVRLRGAGGSIGEALVRGSAGLASSSSAGAHRTGANTAPLDVSRKRQWNATGDGDDAEKRKGSEAESLEALEAGLSKEERRVARKLAKREVRERRRDERRERHEQRRAKRDEERGERRYVRDDARDERVRSPSRLRRDRSRSPDPRLDRHRRRTHEHDRREGERRRAYEDDGERSERSAPKRRLDEQERERSRRVDDDNERRW